MIDRPAAPDASAHSPWKLRSFVHCWFARVGSMGACQMQVMATGWLVYELTGSALDLGLVGLVQFLPRVALTLWAGALAAGALAMSLYLAQRPLRDRVGRTLFISVAVFGLGTIVFALSTSFLLSLGALALLGAADSVSVVIRQSPVQLETPDAMRGRDSAVNSVFIGAWNQLGKFGSGVAAALLGTMPSVVVSGLGTLLIAALWIRLFPTLWRHDRLA